MKNGVSTQKTVRNDERRAGQRGSAGPNGIAIAPPAATRDGVDAQPDSVGSEQVYEQQPPEPFTQRQPLSIQAKFVVTGAGDTYEREADRIARQVMSQKDRYTAPLASDTGPSRNPTRFNVQRTGGRAGFDAPPPVERGIRQARGGGRPLPHPILKTMEQSFGANFTGVRVHTDSRANRLNQTIQSRAFTTGQDIFFKRDEYKPASAGGQKLIAHELTHVVQQEGVKIQHQSPGVHINVKGGAKDRISRAIEIDEKLYDLSEVSTELKKRYGYTPQKFPALGAILASLDNRFFAEWEFLKNEVESFKTSRHLATMEAEGTRDLKWVGPMESMIKGLRRWLTKNDAPEPTAMNCFQTVLYTAVKAGIINKKYMKKALEATGDYESNPLQAINLVRAIIANKAGRIEGWKSQNADSVKSVYQKLASVNIPAGHIVLFGDDGEHVALSTGGKRMPSKANKFKELCIPFGQHEMIENNKGNADEMGSATDVRKTTVEDALDTYLGTTRSITWGPLPTGKQLKELL